MKDGDRIGRVILIGVLVVLVMVVGGTMVLFAQGPGGDSGPSEPETVVPPEQTTPVVDAGGELGLVPEKVTAVEEIELIPESPLSGMISYFKRWSGDTFVPYNGSNTWDYFASGCIYRTGGSAFFNHDVQLPQWAQLDFVRVYFFDNDPANDISLFLYQFDQEGNNSIVAQVSSSGTPGQSSNGVLLNPVHQVDNVNGSLTFRVSLATASTSSLQFCGVRIRYLYPGSINLPSVLR